MSLRNVRESEQSVSVIILCTLLKVYLPACILYLVATSSSTREFPHTLRVVCTMYVYVDMYLSESLLEGLYTRVCLHSRDSGLFVMCNGVVFCLPE